MHPSDCRTAAGCAPVAAIERTSAIAGSVSAQLRKIWRSRLCLLQLGLELGADLAEDV